MELERVQARTLRVVVVSQVFGGAGLAAGITVGALLAQEMLGGAGTAGVPVLLFTLGSALAAYLVGRVSQRLGRRVGLAAGFAAGALGAAGTVAAAVLDSVLLLLPSLLVYGAGTATNLQARYAGTDLAAADRRATAASVALVSTTFGAVAGPMSVEVVGRTAVDLGIPALAGPFALAGTAYAAAGLVILVLMRPDPLLVARDLAATATATDVGPPVDLGVRSRLLRGGVLVGATVMVTTQVAMVAIMTMTPVHMRGHGHDLSDVGLVIGLHVGAMFLPSLVTGRLVDRLGRLPTAVGSALALLAAGVLAALAPGESLPLVALALVLLGLGWNLGLISGTALIVDATTPATRARTQGAIDVLIALAGASGGALSGLVVDLAGFATLSLGGGLLALLLVPVAIRNRDATRRPAAV